MYGSTPTGHAQSYSYFITHASIDGKKIHIKTKVVDDQLPAWIKDIAIDQDLIPVLRDKYQSQIKQAAEINNGDNVGQLQRRLASLKQEKARLWRLLITGNMSDEIYKQLRTEWQEKVRNIQLRIRELKHSSHQHLDDLEIALVLMAKLPELFLRLDEKQKTFLLQILLRGFPLAT